ncbi:hypothetical protein PO909_027530 [Leuciscus waleckii]
MSFQEKQSDPLLKRCTALGYAILTFLLIAVLVGLAQQFKCPCRNEENEVLTVFLFTGPAFFLFVIMFHIRRPLKYGWFQCPERVEDDTPRSCPKAFICCLIPPVMWIFFLLIRGEYVACAMTNWNGVFVFDDELQTRWCKPTEGMRNEMDLTRKYIHQSQVNILYCMSLFSYCNIIKEILN